MNVRLVRRIYRRCHSAREFQQQAFTRRATDNARCMSDGEQAGRRAGLGNLRLHSTRGMKHRDRIPAKVASHIEVGSSSRLRRGVKSEPCRAGCRRRARRGRGTSCGNARGRRKNLWAKASRAVKCQSAGPCPPDATYGAGLPFCDTRRASVGTGRAGNQTRGRGGKSCSGRIRTGGLQGMNLASYHFSTLLRGRGCQSERNDFPSTIHRAAHP